MLFPASPSSDAGCLQRDRRGSERRSFALKGPEKQSPVIWRTETSLLLRNKTLGEPKRLLPSLTRFHPNVPGVLGATDQELGGQQWDLQPGPSGWGLPLLSGTPPETSAAVSPSSQLMAQ